MLTLALLLVAADSEAVLTRRWHDCLSEKGSALARTAEQSETVADATMGACKAQEQAVFDTALKTPAHERLLLGSRNRDPEFVAQRKVEWAGIVRDTRQSVLAQVVELRASLSQK